VNASSRPLKTLEVHILKVSFDKFCDPVACFDFTQDATFKIEITVNQDSKIFLLSDSDEILTANSNLVIYKCMHC